MLGPPLTDQLIRGAFLVAVVLWLWMLLHCIRRDPDRHAWLWMLLIFPVLGGVFYFFGRWLPLYSGAGAGGRRRVRRRDIERAEQAARNIGNPHQHLELGDLLWERRQFDRAAEAYRRALERDPDDPRALWSVGRAAIQAGDLAEAKTRLEKLMGIDREYRTGAAALDYGRVLIGLGEFDAAKAHLGADLKRRGDPEARLLFARALLEQGNTEEARARLDALLDSLKEGASAPARRLARDARQLLRRAGARPEAPCAADRLARGIGRLAAPLERRPFLVFAIVAGCVVAGDFVWRHERRRRRSRLTPQEAALGRRLGFDLDVLRLVKLHTGSAVEAIPAGESEEGKAATPRGIQTAAPVPVMSSLAMIGELQVELAKKGYTVIWLDAEMGLDRIGVIKNPRRE